MNETDMGQNLFDVLLEKKKGEEPAHKYSVALGDIEVGFIVPKEEQGEEDNSVEAQANAALKEVYAPIIERFSDQELEYIIHVMIPNEQANLRKQAARDRGFKR